VQAKASVVRASPCGESEESRRLETTHFEIAVRVEQQVGGLEISMQNVGGVESFEASKSLWKNQTATEQAGEKIKRVRVR